MHGYQVIQELESRSGGRWRPSAGSVYPTLQQLEDEGLVRSEELDGRRTYTLTDEGRAASEHITRLRRHPWFDKDAGREAIDLRRLALQLVGAAIQVKRMGSPEANREARDILVDSRRRLYRLLAEDEGEEAGGASADENVEERDR
jgi:DNA-binding PadR family transcriptional regulator